MLKKLLIFILLLFTVLSNGCATYVKVKLLKPAELNIGSVKKIGLVDFKFKGNWDSDESTSLGAIAGQFLADVILNQSGKAGNNDLLYSLTAYPGRKVTEKLMEKLGENGQFSLISRAPDSSNNTWNDSNYLSSSEIINFGKLLKAQVLISGIGTYTVKDRGEWIDDITTNNGITIRNKKYRINRNINTEITYRINNAFSGELIATKTNSESAGFYQTDNDEDSSRKKLSDWHSTVDDQVNTIIENSVAQIAPHYIYEDREIKDGKTAAMKTGLEYAKRYLWDEARKSWELVLQNPSPESKDDIINATYNLGIYNEFKGNFDKAEKLFEECYKKTSRTEFLDAWARVQTRKHELKKLTEQNHTNFNN